MHEPTASSQRGATTRRWAFVGTLVVVATIGACKRAKPEAADADPPLTSKIAAFTPGEASAPSPTAALGLVLFFDTRVSGDGTMSCATCHDAAKGFADGLPKGKGHLGVTLPRNVPSVINIDTRAPFFWDGRAATAEEQALGPIKNPNEMAGDPDALVKELSDIPEYVARFKLAFGDSKVDPDRIAKALADFERTLVSADSPFDRYLSGDAKAMSPEAVSGYQLFIGKARCVACHDGPHLTDASFHNIGVNDADPGRYALVAVDVLKGAFKTPGLRDTALTAPYFHDGSAATLADVVEHYDRGGDKKDNLDKEMRPLKLSPAEKAALVAFMGSLTGHVVPPEVPRLPRVVTKPRVTSTRELMKNVDGMLSHLDKLLPSMDAGHWDTVRESVEKLTADSEELATMRIRQTKPDRLVELKEKLGALVVELRALDGAAARKSRVDALTAYANVRDRCEDCHVAFRWKKKPR